MKHSSIICLLVLLLAAPLLAQPKVSFRYQQDSLQASVVFAPPQIKADRAGYDQVRFAGLPVLESAGQPALPFMPVRLLLPANRTVVGVQVQTQARQVLPGQYNVRPGAVTLPWQFKAQRHTALQVRHAVYQSNRYFPATLSSPWRVSVLAGYRLLVLNLYPIHYRPLSGRLSYCPRMTIRVQFADQRLPAASARADYQPRVAAQILNTDAWKHYHYQHHRAAEQFPYVIITTANLLQPSKFTHTFAAFVDFLTNLGTPARTVTLAEIYSQYAGRDKPEKIRNFIRYAFEHWGTSYVLLGGDADKGNETVPVRRLPTSLHYVYLDGSSMSVQDNMAADYYYSALDGDFDGNGNGIFGEPEDHIDLEPEVYVGRAPVDNQEELEHFLAKTMAAYNATRTVRAPVVLMVGEKLFSPGQCGVNHTIYGADFMEELANGADTHGFHTQGFNSTWSITRLYDKTGGYWSGSTAKQKLSTSGALWVNHIGHSSPSYNMRLSSYSISGLSNQIPFLYITQGCNAGRFTNESTAPLGQPTSERGYDCFAERLVTAEHGAFAVIANWSYGLSPEDPQTASGDTPGANQYFHRLFVDALFNQAVGIERIGAMLAYAKQSMNPWLLDPQMQTQTVRWVYYQFNLLGDPYVPLPR